MIALVIGSIIGMGIIFGLHALRGVQMRSWQIGNIERHKKRLEEKKHSVKKHIIEQKKSLQEEEEMTQKELEEKDQILVKRLETLNKKQNSLQEKEKHFTMEEKKLQEKNQTIVQNRQNLIDKLSKKISLSTQKIQTTLLDEYIDDLKNNFEHIIQKQKQYLDESEANGIAQNILQLAIQKYGKKNAGRLQLDPISIPKDMWQKNSHAFDTIIKASGIECVYEEEQSTLYISHFNLVRRAIAHYAIEKAIKQKNFETNFITHCLKNASDQVHKNMMEIGKQTFKLLDMDTYNFPDELKKLVGRMYYRTSYGQNVLEHSIEVAYFSEMLAYEVGCDTKVAKIAGLFHDIGKAIDQDTEGSHDHLTKQILEEYHIEYPIVHAAWNHHDAIPMETLEARIVQAADGLSATRPGSRRESSDQFAAKCQMLEDKAYEHKEVQKAFVIQAGREVRALFDARNVSEDVMGSVIKKIAKSVEEEGGYPGEILIHGVRELRAIHRTKERKEKTKSF